MQNKIITINRQYGSNGREIGKVLAEKLGIGFYDKEIITLAAKESGYTESIFENADERPSNSLLYSIVNGQYNPRAWFYGGTDVLTGDTLFSIQAEVIRKVSENPCVIVGRCADFLLRDNPSLVSVFTHASFENRVARTMQANPSLSEKEATGLVKKMDKSRTTYYSYYANRQWDAATNYDLCLCTDTLSVDNAVELIEEFIRRVSK